MASTRPVGASGDTAIATMVVVDPRPIVAGALAALLAEHLDPMRVETAAEASTAPYERSVAVVPLPPGAERHDTMARLLAAGHRVITFGPDTRQVAVAAESGSWGHVDEGSDVARLVAAIQAAAEGRPLFAPGERSDLVTRLHQERSAWRSDGLASLTRREVEVLRELCQGRRPAEIAEDGFVSVRTVRNQIQSILTKLNVHSQLEAVAVASRHPVFLP